MYAARHSGMKKEMFGYVRGGYSRVLERFGEVLIENGIEIRLNSPIYNIQKLPNRKIPLEAVTHYPRPGHKPPNHPAQAQ